MATNTATLAADRRARLARDIPQHVSPGPVDARLAAAAPRSRRHGVARDRRGVHRADDPVRHRPDREGLGARGRRQLRAADVRRRRRSRSRRRPRPTPRSRRPTAASDFQSTVVDPIGDVHRGAQRRQARRATPRRRAGRQVGRSARRRDGRHPEGREVGAAAAVAPKRARRRCRSAATSGAATCSRRRSRARRRRSSSASPRRSSRRSSARVLGALAGYYGRWVDDALNWFYSVFSSIPVPAADPRGRGGAAAEGHADDHPDPRPHRLDRRVPPDPRRVPEAQGARIRAGRRRASARRTRARCSCTSSPTSRTSCWCSCRSSSSGSSRPR